MPPNFLPPQPERAHDRTSFVPMLAVLACGVLLVHAVAAASVVLVAARGDAIGDWTSFYAAGALVRMGDGARLYDPDIQKAMQHALFGEGVSLNAFPLPAFTALLFAPLSGLSFAASYFLMFAINFSALGALAAVAWRWLRPLPSRLRIAVVACAALSAPTLSVLLLGQLDLFVVGAIVSCFALLRGGRPGLAGALLALALCKPHLAAGAVLLLLATGQWRALGGFAAVGVPLIILPAAILGPGTLLDQVALVASYPGSSTENSVAAAMMVNVRGAATSLTGSSSVWVWLPPLAIVAATALAVSLRAWRRLPPTDPQAWALAMMLPLMYSPHLHLQSLVLLVAAGILYLRAASDQGQVRHTTEIALLAFIALTAFWLLAIAGFALMFVPVLAAFTVVSRRWPRAAGLALLEPAVEEQRIAA